MASLKRNLTRPYRSIERFFRSYSIGRHFEAEHGRDADYGCVQNSWIANAAAAAHVFVPGSGSLDCLQLALNVVEIRLDDCEIEGALASLSGLFRLKILELQRTRIQGSLKDLARCQSLEVIDLEDCAIEG